MDLLQGGKGTTSSISSSKPVDLASLCQQTRKKKKTVRSVSFKHGKNMTQLLGSMDGTGAVAVWEADGQ